MKDNVKAWRCNTKLLYLHGQSDSFHIKRRDVQGLVFLLIMFEKYTLNFYFENVKVGTKTTIADLQPLIALNVFARLRIFMQPGFQRFLSRALDVFSQNF